MLLHRRTSSTLSSSWGIFERHTSLSTKLTNGHGFCFRRYVRQRSERQASFRLALAHLIDWSLSPRWGLALGARDRRISTIFESCPELRARRRDIVS